MPSTISFGVKTFDRLKTNAFERRLSFSRFLEDLFESFRFPTLLFSFGFAYSFFDLRCHSLSMYKL